MVHFDAREDVIFFVDLYDTCDDLLPFEQIKNYTITEFFQGRTRRWAVGWSFTDTHLPDASCLRSFPSWLFIECLLAVNGANPFNCDRSSAVPAHASSQYTKQIIPELLIPYLIRHSRAKPSPTRCRIK